MTARFHYIAVDQAGKRIEGVIEGLTKTDVLDELVSKGAVPVKLEQLKDGLWSKLNQPVEAFQRLKLQDLASFLKQLTPLIAARLTVDHALSILAKSNRQKNMSSLIKRLSSHIRKGRSLAQSMADEHRDFPHFVIAMVDAGEKSGQLDETLASLSRMLDRSAKFQSSVIGALIYPLILLVLVTLTVILMVVFVIPQFSAVFGGNIDALPWSTAMVMRFGTFANENLFGFLLAGAFIAIGFVAFFAHAERRRRFDGLLLKSNRLSTWLVATDVIRYARTLGVLLQSAQPLSDSMRLSTSVVKNKAFQKDLETCVEQVRLGKRISKTFEALDYLPSVFIQLVSVGDETAQLGQMLNQSAEIMEEQLEQRLQRFLAVFAPLLTLALGGVVAGLIGSLIIGMMSVNSFI